MKGSARIGLATMAMAITSLGAIGCQTYEVGQVLPSGFHMRDDIQYFRKGPQFPLQNELNAMQAAEEEREPRGPLPY